MGEGETFEDMFKPYECNPLALNFFHDESKLENDFLGFSPINAGSVSNLNKIFDIQNQVDKLDSYIK